METNKQNKTGRIIATIILVICLVGFGLLLVACNQEESPVDITATVNVSVAGPSPETDVVVTHVDSISPTATPTQSEKAAEVAAQQFVPDYFPNKDACHEAVAGGMVTECMYAGSVQSVTRPEWEQLFPNAEFYLIRLDAYHPENEYGDFSSRHRLVARQDDRQYNAETFNQLLSVNNIRVTNENYELAAQAFALMTLNAEVFSYQIAFTHWEPIDMKWAFSHFDRRLQAWTELGGQEIQWYFGFENESVLEVLGPDAALLGHEVGDYVPLEPDSNFNRNYGSGLSLEYRFSLNQSD